MAPAKILCDVEIISVEVFEFTKAFRRFVVAVKGWVITFSFSSSFTFPFAFFRISTAVITVGGGEGVAGVGFDVV